MSKSIQSVEQKALEAVVRNRYSAQPELLALALAGVEHGGDKIVARMEARLAKSGKGLS